MREEIKEINHILFMLSKRSLESYDQTLHMLFPKPGQATVVLVITGWSQGGIGALGWHRDVGPRGGSGTGAGRAGVVKTGTSEHKESWLGM